MQADRRDSEQHDFWLPFAIVLIAVSLLLVGTRHITGLETESGEAARETELIKAFSKGGLERVAPVTTFEPALFNDPAALAVVMERMAVESAQSSRLRYRVNTGAADPCPT
jgi:hypothetical protein